MLTEFVYACFPLHNCKQSMDARLMQGLWIEREKVFPCTHWQILEPHMHDWVGWSSHLVSTSVSTHNDQSIKCRHMLAFKPGSWLSSLLLFLLHDCTVRSRKVWTETSLELSSFEKHGKQSRSTNILRFVWNWSEVITAHWLYLLCPAMYWCVYYRPKMKCNP